MLWNILFYLQCFLYIFVHLCDTETECKSHIAAPWSHIDALEHNLEPDNMTECRQGEPLHFALQLLVQQKNYKQTLLYEITS